MRSQFDHLGGNPPGTNQLGEGHLGEGHLGADHLGIGHHGIGHHGEGLEKSDYPRSSMHDDKDSNVKFMEKFNLPQ